jgi:hypothetical protein
LNPTVGLLVDTKKIMYRAAPQALTGFVEPSISELAVFDRAAFITLQE